jgi:hypothetical protein
LRRGRSRILQLLAVQSGAIFLMLSCASSQPSQRLTVHLVPGFVGPLHVSTCVPSASANDITANSAGMGETSACPSRETSVTIVVVRGDQQSTLAPGDVSILRTDDGIATSIRATVRP